MVSFAGTFADLADDLDDLDPPERLDDLHSELVDAISNYARSLAAYAEGAPPVLTGPGDQLDEICKALERAASEEGVSIELLCSEESDGEQTINFGPEIRPFRSPSGFHFVKHGSRFLWPTR
jgi:hypothetical protein